MNERVTAGMARATAQRKRLARASRLNGTQASSATRYPHGLAIAQIRKRRGMGYGTAWHVVQKYTSSLARHAGAHRQRSARTQGSQCPCASSGTVSSILAAGSPFPISGHVMSRQRLYRAQPARRLLSVRSRIPSGGVMMPGPRADDHVWTLREVLLFRVPPWPQPVGV